MNKILVLFVLMYICHYLADFVFQGQIALYKQRKWWRDNYNKKMYKNDWLISLFIHSITWTLAILLPGLLMGLLTNPIIFIILFILNTLFHAYIDHLKCNMLCINLVRDQLYHMLQIIISFFIIIFLN